MEIGKLTMDEITIILNSSGLGRSKEQYRTHHCTYADNPQLLKLVDEGYFTGPHSSGFLTQGRAMFHLTEQGIQAAWKIKGTITE